MKQQCEKYYIQSSSFVKKNTFAAWPLTFRFGGGGVLRKTVIKIPTLKLLLDMFHDFLDYKMTKKKIGFPTGKPLKM